jgi:hypothetical protein
MELSGSFPNAIHSDFYSDRFVMPDLIRHPVRSWIPAYAGMTACAMTYGALYKWISYKDSRGEVIG